MWLDIYPFYHFFLHFYDCVHPQESRCCKIELVGLRKVLCWFEVASLLLMLPGCASLCGCSWAVSRHWVCAKDHQGKDMSEVISHQSVMGQYGGRFLRL